MKPISLFFILFFALDPSWLCGQYTPMVEEGKFWIYYDNTISGDAYIPVNGHAITFKGDTTINALQYKKVIFHRLKGHQIHPPPSWTFDYPYESESQSLHSFIREDTLERKVYHLPLFPQPYCDSTEYLLFDYSLGTGDTLNACIYDFVGGRPDNPYPIGLIDSIGVAERFGKSRNTLYTTGIQTYHGLPPIGELLIVEGVGLELYGLFPNPMTDFADYCEDAGEFCELLLADSHVEADPEINVYPNPTRGEVVMTFSQSLSGATCSVFDCLGRVAQSFNLSDATSISQQYLPGVYYWTVSHRGSHIDGGMIVVQQ
jgi:hypothetical protein